MAAPPKKLTDPRARSEGSRLLRWSTVATLMAGAVLLRGVLNPWLGPGQPFLFLYLAILASTILAGWRASAVGGAAGLVLSELLFVRPTVGIRPLQTGDLVHLGSAAIVAGAIIALAAISQRLRSSVIAAELLANRAVGEARRLESLHRATFEQAAVGMVHADESGRILAANQRACEMLGYSAERLTEMTIREITHPPDWPATEQRLRPLVAHDSPPVVLEKRYVRQDGSLLWASATVSVQRDEATGRVASLLGVIEDIGARKRAEEDLLRSNQRLRVLAHASEDLLRAKDPGEFLAGLSRRLAEHMGLEVFVHYLLNPDGCTMRLAACGGIDGAAAAKLRQLAVGEAICGSVAATQRPIVVEDVRGSTDPRTEHIRRLGLTAYASYPLLARGRVIGTLSVGTRGGGRFDPDSLALLRAVSDLAAIVIERRCSEDALRESEERYRTFLAQSTEGIWRFEFDEPLPPELPEEDQVRFAFRHAYLAECNTAMARQYGYERPEEIVGRPVSEFLVESDPANAEYLRSFVRSGYRLLDAESHEVDRAGRPRVFLNNLVGILDDHGRLLRAWGTQRDVTARMQAEEELRRSEERYRTLVGQVTDYAIFSLDPSARATSWNEGVRRVLGFEEEEFIGSDTSRLIFTPEDQAAGVPDRELRTAEAEGAASNDRWMRRKDGTRFWAMGTTSALRDERGGLIGFTKVMRDQTALWRAQDDLRGAKERLDAALEAADVGTWRIDVASRTAARDAGMNRLLGLEPAESTQPLDDYLSRIHPEDRPLVTAAFERSLRDGAIYEHEHRVLHPDGRIRWLRDRGRLVRGDGVRHAVMTGAAADITDRKAAEQALRESEQRSRALSEATFDAILMHDNCIAIEINDSFTQMFGYTRDEILGRDAAVLVLSPESYDDVMRRIAEGSEEPYEATLRRKDGSMLRAELRARVIPYRGRRVRVVSARDITARKLAEEELARHRDHLQEILLERTAALEASHNQLRLSERLAGLGTLAAGLGHDMGNLLLPLRTRLESIEANTPSETVRDDVAAIRKAAEYLQRLTHGLRLLALDPDDAQAAAPGTDLHDWWPDAEPLLRNALPRAFHLDHSFPPGPLAVAIARPGLTQAIFNLVQNAGQAMRDHTGGRVTVWAERGHAAGPEGGVIRVGVTDDGPGMTPDVVRRCLEPFFTTRARTHATGMGLALVHATVQKVGGSVEVHSEPGRGSTFVLVLPAVTRDAVPPRGRPAARVSISDPRLRSFVLSLLGAMDFEICDAPSPGANGACLWVMDARAADSDAAAQFVHADGPRHLVVLGDPPPHLPAGRVIALGAAPKPAAIRQALRDAVHACDPGHDVRRATPV